MRCRHVVLALLLLLAAPAPRAAAGLPVRTVGSTGSGEGEVWPGRHPEASEVAATLRRLRKRLERESREARERGRLEVALECEEEIGQVGEMWKILEELNGATIPLQDANTEL
jgi:hypothetical protein